MIHTTALIWITILTCLAFVSSALGLYSARRNGIDGAKRMNSERATREQIMKSFHEETQAIQHLMRTDAQEWERLNKEAAQRWSEAHDAAGLEPWSYQMVNSGRELLAERIVRELESASRVDVGLIGFGLACGLAASVWSIWA